MEYKIIIPGRFDSLNEYLDFGRQNRFISQKHQRQTENSILPIVKSQLKGAKISTPVWMDYLWVEMDKRRDKDNISFAKKFIQDALVKTGYLRDDGWDEIEGFTDTFAVDARKPRIEILIREVG